jgi:hypothetical protein
MLEDFRSAQRDELVKKSGFKVLDRIE